MSGARDVVQGLVKELARQQLSRADGQTVQLQLDSEALGPIRVEVVMQERALHAAFVTADPAVKLLLEHEQFSLRSALLAQGVQPESFSVSIGNPGGNPDGHPGALSSGMAGGSGSHWNSPGPQGSDSEATANDAPLSQHRSGDRARRGLVDLYV